MADNAPEAPAGSVATADSDLDILARQTAVEAREFLATVTEVATGESPGTAIPLLLLATSQLLLAGARLGAIEDVVPEERFEPDPGPDADLDPLRTNLANLLEGLDEYADVVDPVTQAELTKEIKDRYGIEA